MPKLIIANWKENPATLKEAILLAKESDAPGVVIAPPFPFLGAVRAVARHAALAAQDLFYEERGAFTGAVSASQLASVGVTYGIIGHSERRRLGDTDEMVAKKVHAAMHAGIVPILCIGETRSEHEAGTSNQSILRQLQSGLSLVASGYTLSPILVYEPVWAISTEPGATPDTPENAVYMINFIQKTLVANRYSLTPKYIYGGSVNPTNAESFLKEKDVAGALVGGASLKDVEIKKIIAIAKQY